MRVPVRLRPAFEKVGRGIDWFAEPVLPRRIGIWIVCFVLGCLVAAVAWVDQRGQQRDEAARKTNKRESLARDRRLASAIKEVRLLAQEVREPTPQQIRRQVAHLIEGLTPEQAKELRRRAFMPFGSPLDGEDDVEGGGDSPGTGPPSQPGPPSPGGGQNPEPPPNPAPDLLPDLPGLPGLPLPCLPLLRPC